MKHFKFNLQCIWPVLVLVVMLALAGCVTNTTTPVVETPQVTLTPSPDPTVTPTKTPAMTPTPQKPAHLKVDPDDLAGIVVRFSHSWTGEFANSLMNIADEFSRVNPYRIRVEVESHGGATALVEAIQRDLDNGEVPGLIAAHPYHLSALEGDYVSVSLTHYFTDPDWGFDGDARSDIAAVFLEQFTIGGHLIALPFVPQATVMFYNQTWADELGYPLLPADEQDFRDQICAATSANWQKDDPEIRGTGGWVLNLDPNVLANWYYAFGGTLPPDETPQFNNQAGQAAFGYLKSIIDPPDGCIWVAREPYPYVNFANRLALMYAGTLDQIPAQMSWLDVVESEDEWVVMGFPGPEGQRIIVDGPGVLVTADTPEKQMAAWLFARYLLEPDIQAKLVQSGFTLPVRESAAEYLREFKEDYPQWAQGATMIESAVAVPASDGWGIGQWLLQDAVNRLMQAEESELPVILGELDAIIRELEGMSP